MSLGTPGRHALLYLTVDFLIVAATTVVVVSVASIRHYMNISLILVPEIHIVSRDVPSRKYIQGDDITIVFRECTRSVYYVYIYIQYILYTYTVKSTSFTRFTIVITLYTDKHTYDIYTYTYVRDKLRH